MLSSQLKTYAAPAGRTYVHTAIASFGGQAIAFALDSERRFWYSVLDLGDRSRNSRVDHDFWSLVPLAVPFPAEMLQAGYRDTTLIRLAPVLVEGKPDPFRATTARLTARVPFQVVTDDQHLFILRQSVGADHPDAWAVSGDRSSVLLADNSLLADRYALVDGELRLRSEVRFRRSRHITKPAGPKDSLGTKDLEGRPFHEPTHKLGMVHGLKDGRFCALIVPTAIPGRRRWQIFSCHARTGLLDALSIERSADGLFDPRGKRYYTCENPDHAPIFINEDTYLAQRRICVESLKNTSVCGWTLVPQLPERDYADFCLKLTGEKKVAVDCGKKIDLRSRSFTIECWVRRESNEALHVLAGMGTTGPLKALRLGFLADNRFTFDFGAGGAQSAAQYTDGAWCHWACVYAKETKTGTVYRNGEQVAKVEAMESLEGEGTLYLGRSGGATDGYFNGAIDEVRVWSRALTGDEIRTEMRVRLIGDEPGLAAYWRCDEGEGDLLYDRTGNGSDGKVQGDAPFTPEWGRSGARLAPHPSVSRRSFKLFGRTFESGPSAVLFYQQEAAEAGYDHKAKLQKQSARVLLAVATKGATARTEVAALDLAVSRQGELAATPLVVHVAPLAEEGFTGQGFAAKVDEIAKLEASVHGLRDEISHLRRELDVPLPELAKRVEALNLQLQQDEAKLKAQRENPLNYWCTVQPAAEPAKRLTYLNAVEGTFLPLTTSNDTSDVKLQWRFNLLPGNVYSIQNRAPEHAGKSLITPRTLEDGTAVWIELRTVAPDTEKAMWSVTASGGTWKITRPQSQDGGLGKANVPWTCLVKQPAEWTLLIANPEPVTDAVKEAERAYEQTRVALARTAFAVNNFQAQTELLGQRLDEIEKAQRALAEARRELAALRSLAMPLVYVDPLGLSVRGGVLELAETLSAPQAFDSASGRLALYFQGAGNRFLAAHYDMRTARARFAISSGGGKVLCVARHAGSEMSAQTVSIAVENGGSAEKCQVTFKVSAPTLKIEEVWKDVPRRTDLFARTLNGHASTRKGDPDYYDYTQVKLTEPYLATRGSVLFSILLAVDKPAEDLVLNGSGVATPELGESCRWVAQPSAYALAFDGIRDSAGLPHSAMHLKEANQYVECGTIDLKDKSFTLELWARAASVDSDTYFFGQGQQGSNLGLHVGFRGKHQDSRAGRFTFAFWSDDINTPPLVDTEWHHWACVYDKASNTGWIYRDGLLIMESKFQNSYKGEGQFWIGTAPAGGYCKGSVDEARIWSEPRSAEQIRRDKDRRLDGPVPGLTACWSFGRQMPDGRFRDRSGNGYHAKLAGTTVYEVQPSPADGLKGGDVSRRLAMEAWIRPDSLAETAQLLVHRSERSRYMLAIARQNVSSALALGPQARVVCKNIDLRNRSFTIELWARLPKPGPSCWLIGQGEYQGGKGLHIGRRGDSHGENKGRFTLDFYGNAINSTNSYTDESWNHWACVYDDASKKGTLYYNGMEAGTGTFSASYQGQGPLWIGAFVDQYSQAAIDEVRIWYAARSQAQIMGAMKRPLFGHEIAAPLAAYWHFEGLDAVDSSGNGYSGRIEGAAQNIESPMRSGLSLIAGMGSTFVRTVQAAPLLDGSGAPRWTHVAAVFEQSYALQLDGESAVLDGGRDTSLNLCDDLTLEIAFRCDALDKDRGLLTKGRPGQGDGATLPYALHLQPTGEVVFSFESKSRRSPSYSSQNKVKVNTLHRLAVTRKRRLERREIKDSNGLLTDVKVEAWDEIVIDLDGVRTLHKYFGDAPEGTRDPLEIGKAFSSGPQARFFKGVISEVRVWSRARDIQEIWQRPAGEGQGLVAWWRLEDGEGNVALDSAGANHAVLAGPKWIENPDPGASRFDCYLDGLPAAAANSQPVDYGPEQLTLGANAGRHFYHGLLDEVRIWRAPRTPDQILDGMSSRLAPGTRDLAALYTFAETDGRWVREQSGNGHPLKLQRDDWVNVVAAQLEKTTGVVRVAKFTMPDGPFTASLWVFFHSDAGPCGLMTAEDGSWRLDADSSGPGETRVRFRLSTDGGPAEITAVCEPGVWHHVAATYDKTAKTMILYVNAREVSRKDNVVSKHIPGEHPLIFGHGLSGYLAEVRIWPQALTAAAVFANSRIVLTGSAPGLLGCWSFQTLTADKKAVVDLSIHKRNGELQGSIVVGSEKLRIEVPAPGRYLLSTAPVGWEAPVVRSVLGGVGTPSQSTVESIAGACEYGTLQLGAEGDRVGILKRAHSFTAKGDWHLTTGHRVGGLKVEWIGQAQYAPQVVGYIEGAPPVPSENLTLEAVDGQVPTFKEYAGATAVEMKTADSTTLVYTASHETGGDRLTQLYAGGLLKQDFTASITFGYWSFGVTLSSARLAFGERGQFESSTNRSREAGRTAGDTIARSSRTSLRGHWRKEKIQDSPQVHRWRYAPRNVGLALVRSETADVFALRLEESGAFVQFVFEPNPEIPKDWNLLTFALNPYYVKQGTLDGLLGRSPNGALIQDPDYPNAGKDATPYSYLKPGEAYALKRRIERQEQRLQAYFETFNPSVSPDGGALPGLPDFGRRNIVNSYVWTAQGGLFSETQQRLDVTHETMGDSQSSRYLRGYSHNIEASVLGLGGFSELSSLGGAHMSAASVKNQDSQTSFSLDATANAEGDIQVYKGGLPEYDQNGRPVLKPGVVDAYRFMSFYLQPSEENFDELAQVVDQRWLAESLEKDAVALRQALRSGQRSRQEAKSLPWRILHRVTFVSRVVSGTTSATAAEPLAAVIEGAGLHSEYEMVQRLEPYVGGSTATYATFESAVRTAIHDYAPELAPAEEQVLRTMCLYFQVFPDELT